MAAGGGAPVGDFAFDGDVAVGALDQVADVADELADGKDGVLRGGGGFGAGGGRGDGEGTGLLGEDVGGGGIGGWVRCRIEERGGGGARGGLAGTGAAEVGEAGEVVGHRKD